MEFITERGIHKSTNNQQQVSSNDTIYGTTFDFSLSRFHWNFCSNFSTSADSAAAVQPLGRTTGGVQGVVPRPAGHRRRATEPDRGDDSVIRPRLTASCSCSCCTRLLTQYSGTRDTRGPPARRLGCEIFSRDRPQNFCRTDLKPYFSSSLLRLLQCCCGCCRQLLQETTRTELFVAKVLLSFFRQLFAESLRVLATAVAVTPGIRSSSWAGRVSLPHRHVDHCPHLTFTMIVHSLGLPRDATQLRQLLMAVVGLGLFAYLATHSTLSFGLVILLITLWASREYVAHIDIVIPESSRPAFLEPCDLLKEITGPKRMCVSFLVR